MGRGIPNAIYQSIGYIIQTAIDAVRRATIFAAQELLNDPHTSN